MSTFSEDFIGAVRDEDAYIYKAAACGDLHTLQNAQLEGRMLPYLIHKCADISLNNGHDNVVEWVKINYGVAY